MTTWMTSYVDAWNLTDGEAPVLSTRKTPFVRTLGRATFIKAEENSRHGASGSTKALPTSGSTR